MYIILLIKGCESDSIDFLEEMMERLNLKQLQLFPKLRHG